MTVFNKAGQCKQCGEQMWDITVPRKLRGGWRTAFFLADGTSADLTLCDGCAMDPNFQRLWENILDGWRQSLGEPHSLMRQARDNFILDVFYKMPWSAVR